MKKKHFKTTLASLLLSCTLLASPLSAIAAAQTNTSTAATATAAGPATATPKPAASGTWKTVKGYHYYYNAKGKKVTGKVKIGSRYYFFDKKAFSAMDGRKSAKTITISASVLPRKVHTC